jgi:hypothetical protein
MYALVDTVRSILCEKSDKTSSQNERKNATHLINIKPAGSVPYFVESAERLKCIALFHLFLSTYHTKVFP